MISGCVVVLLLTVQALYGARFPLPSSNSRVWANNTTPEITGEVTLSWTYQLDGADANSINVVCGYYDGRNLVSVISKLRDTGTIQISNSLGNRVQLIQNSNNRVMSFKLTRVTKADGKDYVCRMSYTNNGLSQDPVLSKLITVEVLDFPKFVKCLDNIQPVDAGKTLDTECYVSGNPRPKLNCVVYSKTNDSLTSYPGFEDEKNISYSFPMTRTSQRITCYAVGQNTGRINKTAYLTVYGRPFAIKDLVQIASSDETSIRLQWNSSTIEDLGNRPLVRYRLTWWVSSLFTEGQNGTTVLLQPPLEKSINQGNQDYFKLAGKVYYEMRKLDVNQIYSFFVVAENTDGNGDRPLSAIQCKPGFNPTTKKSSSSDDTTYIIIGVILGIVALVLIVILIVVLSKKCSSDSGKRYPTSYIEDAVEYPPNQGHSLYANVNKKQKTVSRSDSTSGYPDVVADGNSMPMSSYENSNKAYV